MNVNSSKRLIGIDVTFVTIVAVLVCFWSNNPRTMLISVLSVFALRWIAWGFLHTEERRHHWIAEMGMMIVCTILGAANDWNTVVRHRVYDYTVPSDIAEFSSIPLWMLLYWGLILRAIANVSRGWGESSQKRALRLGSIKIEGILARGIFLGVLVIVTRQCIYRLYEHPVWSWVPFAIALALYFMFTNITSKHWQLGLLFLVLGPVVEAVFIQIGGLHRYKLGWLWGVPLWIQLWWVLAVLVWSEFADQIEGRLAKAFPAR